MVFMWISTSNGLNRYDGQKFKIFVHEPTDSLSLPSSWIMSLFEDYNGELWIGTDNGLCRFNRLKESFDRFIVNPGNPASLNEPRIKDICQTAIDSSALWIAIQVGERATNGGLHRFDLETKEITSFQYNPDDSTTISDNALRFLLEDDDGLLWIGTWAYGVNRFDPSHWQNPSFTRFVNDSENQQALVTMQYGME